MQQQPLYQRIVEASTPDKRAAIDQYQRQKEAMAELGRLQERARRHMRAGIIALGAFATAIVGLGLWGSL